MSKTQKLADQQKKRNKGFQNLGTLFDNYEMGKPGKYISREFQDFGYRLALDLDDLKHKSLYMKLAKNEERGLLEAARRFVIDADHARSKGRLFMWKLKELKKESLKK
jgi:hypothetical protein